MDVLHEGNLAIGAYIMHSVIESIRKSEIADEMYELKRQTRPIHTRRKTCKTVSLSVVRIFSRF